MPPRRRRPMKPKKPTSRSQPAGEVIEPAGEVIDLLRVTFALMDGKDVARAACVCRTWRAAANDEQLWQRLLDARWPHSRLECLEREGQVELPVFGVGLRTFRWCYSMRATLGRVVAGSASGPDDAHTCLGLIRMSTIMFGVPQAWLLEAVHEFVRKATIEDRERRRAAGWLKVLAKERLTHLLSEESILGDSDDAVVLLDAACALSLLVDPAADVQAVREAVLALSEDARAHFQALGLSGADNTQRLRALTAFLFHPPAAEGADAALQGLGFRGCETTAYYTPQQTSLAVCLETRRGLPITLAVLLIIVGHHAGVEVQGVALPGHFRTRAAPPEDLFIDCFDGGTMCGQADVLRALAAYNKVPRSAQEAEQWLAAAPVRSIVERMWENLKRMQVDFLY